MDGRTTCVKIMITTDRDRGRPSGSKTRKVQRQTSLMILRVSPLACYFHMKHFVSDFLQLGTGERIDGMMCKITINTGQVDQFF